MEGKRFRDGGIVEVVHGSIGVHVWACRTGRGKRG